MKLLLVTDHCFLRHPTGIYDTYCFDQKFFEDYYMVFKSIKVICRIENIQTIPKGAFRSDNTEICFIDVPNLRRLSWLLRVNQVSQPMLRQAIENTDVIIARVPSELGWLACRLAYKMNKPYMIEVIGDPKQAWTNSGKSVQFRLIGSLEAHRLKLIARYAEVGSYVNQNNLPKTYPLNNKSYDCISSIRLDTAEIITNHVFSKSNNKFKIIQIGRLEPRKRTCDLFRACHKVIEDGFNIQLHIVGDGAERTKLESLSQKLHLDDKIIFHGQIADRKLLFSLLDQSDLFVLTSASEGLPRSIIEAMSRGLPVIGTKTPGVDELLRNSELFDIGDIFGLANLIEKLISNNQRLTEISEYGIKVAKQYTSEVLSPRRISLYKKLQQKGEEIALRKETN